MKNTLAPFIKANRVIRTLFYRLLGLLFLREWNVKRALRRLFRGNSYQSMLDAGSGFGQYSYYCARHFPAVTIRAIDVKKDQIEDCTRYFLRSGLTRVHCAVDDLLTMQYNAAFDFILSVDVMEHIDDDRRVFRNFFQALKPGGTLLVNTPSNLGGSDAHGPDDESFIEEHARTGYGVDEIKTKLTSAGFHVEQVEFTYGTLGMTAWRIGIKVPMKLMSVTRLLFLVLPFYYLVTLPIVLPLMVLDYRARLEQGAGLLVVARKPA